NEKDLDIRVAAAEALGAMRYERAVAGLTRQFQNSVRGPLAETALEALARIAHPSTAPIFVQQLASKNQAVMAMAIEGLDRIGDRTQREAIETAAGADPDDRVRLAASFAGVTIGEATLDPLVEGLRKPKVVAQARRYLTELARGRVTEFTR